MDGFVLLGSILIGLVQAVASRPADEGGAPAAPTQPPSTLKMIERLKECAAKLHPEQVTMVNDRRVPLLLDLWKKAANPGEGRRLHEAYALELLLNGQTEEAIKEYEAVRAEYLAKNPPNTAKKLPGIRSSLAIAWMRLGEQENCLAAHGVDSCIAPLKGGGIHQIPRGAENALRELTDILKEEPDDLGARWLYNVASMQLGRWPDQVPKELLVPPEAFASEQEFPRFLDVAPLLGIDTITGAGGAILEDFDRDGFVDFACSGFGLNEQLRVYRSNGDGTFTERTKEAGLEGLVGGFNCMHFDYDNDGFPDLFVPRGAWFKGEGRFPHSLLRNRGDFTFEDVTEKAGMLTFAPCQKMCTADFDNDGWLDLYVGNEHSPECPIPPELWWNQRDGTFKEIAAEVGLPPNCYVKGAAAGDYDNDGRIDLYISVLAVSAPGSHLMHNEPVAAAPGRPPFRFTSATKSSGIVAPVNGFTSWWFDYDNDGWLDLAVSGYTVQNQKSAADIARLYLGMPTIGERFHLFRNLGDGKFADVSKETGIDRSVLTMGANFGDIDSDGWLDCYFGTGDPDLRTLMPNKMFRNDGGKRFLDITTAGGFGHLQKGHGTAFGDVDNDGDQDVYHSLGGTFTGDMYQNVLFENPGFPNRWITIELLGKKSNRFGMGTRIAVTVVTPAGKRTIHVVGGTGSDFGGNTLAQEIGLGDATSIEKIELFWPASGIKQLVAGTAAGVAMDSKFRIEEGSDVVTPVPMKKIDLSPEGAEAAGHHHHHDHH